MAEAYKNTGQTMHMLIHSCSHLGHSWLKHHLCNSPLLALNGKEWQHFSSNSVVGHVKEPKNSYSVYIREYCR